MEIKGKVHCFFEQSGTFKNEFIKLGIPAEDYDLQNNFGQTDHADDLFKAIEDAYDGGASLFDNITKEDLIMAFFPCIYFCENNQLATTYMHANYKNLTFKEMNDKIIERTRNRQHFYEVACKMFAVAKMKGLRLVMENPWLGETFLKRFFVMPPAMVDNNRMLRGDYFVKPTAYWFIGCKPTYGRSYQNDKKRKRIGRIPGGVEAGVCSEERSMISPDYARNFICDFILGKEQAFTERSLFDSQF